MNFLSYSSISGSDKLLPINLFNDPTVFLKLEVSAVLAASPMKRWRGVKEMRELQGSAYAGVEVGMTHGVARLETSLVMISIPFLRATPIFELRLPRSIPTTLCIKSVEKDKAQRTRLTAMVQNDGLGFRQRRSKGCV